MFIDEEEAENDDTGAESGVSATRSSSVPEITFDKSLPRTHAVSGRFCCGIRKCVRLKI